MMNLFSLRFLKSHVGHVSHICFFGDKIIEDSICIMFYGRFPLKNLHMKRFTIEQCGVCSVQRKDCYLFSTHEEKLTSIHLYLLTLKKISALKRKDIPI